MCFDSSQIVFVVQGSLVDPWASGVTLADFQWGSLHPLHAYASQETLTLEPLCIVALRFFSMLIPELTSIGFKPCPANSASLQNSLKKKKALEGWDVEWRRETFRRPNNNWLFRFWLNVGRYKNQLDSLGNNTKLVKDLIPEHVSAWSGY